MQKYAAYRERILNEERFFNAIDNQSKILSGYRQKINDLNPNIIPRNEQLDQKNEIIGLVKQDAFDLEPINTVKSYIALVNDVKQEQLINQISDFLTTYNANSIIDKKSGNISLEWANNLEGSEFLNQISNKLVNDQKHLMAFHGVSQNKINKLQEAIQSSADNNYEWLNNYQVNLLQEKGHNRSWKYFYFYSAGALILLIVTILIFIVIGVSEHV